MNKIAWGFFILVPIVSLLIGVGIGSNMGGARIIYSERILNNTIMLESYTTNCSCPEPYQAAADKIKEVEADYDSAQRFKDMINK